MFVYSNKIVKFIGEVKSLIKQVVLTEIGLEVHGDRFYNRKRTTSYPIKVVVFNNKSILGYFESSFFELGFHESLMHTSRDQLRNIIRHELAHYMTFINFGGQVFPHGDEFRAFCQRMGWGEDVYKASICIEEMQNIPVDEESSVLRKIRKLMALSTSSNPHESEQAMIKSQQLLMQHNIESKYISDEEEEKVFFKRIMKQKKDNAKMRSIANIVTTFFVSVVYNRSEDHVHLEIVGSAVNIEIAEYVANFLVVELDKLWLQVQQETDLKGMIAKNSFFYGLSMGYCDKIKALKRDYSSEMTTALMVIEKAVVDARDLVYSGLRSGGKSSARLCPESAMLGEAMGRKLNINPALNQSSEKSGWLIGQS